MDKIEDLVDLYKKNINVPYCPFYYGSGDCQGVIVKCKDRSNCRIKYVVFACQMALKERKHPINVNELAEYILNELGLENPKLIKEV